MGVFEHFPYTNFHDLNLDWIVQELEKLSDDVRDFISINAIKYANPIQWDITSQYEKNTVVLDKDGNAYLSVQAVPAGVSLDRTEYWTNIGNFSALWESVKEAITIPDEGHKTIASAPRAVNDLVWVNSQLLEVTSQMLAGDQYVIGSNCRIYSIQIMLREFLEAVANEAAQRENDIAELNGKIDGLAIIYENVSELVLEEKTLRENSTVGVARGGSFWKISNTGTESPLVKRLANGQYASYIENGEINVVGIGIEPDTETDYSEEIQWLLDNKHTNLYFPSGTYNFSVSIYRRFKIHGDFESREIQEESMEWADFELNTVFKPVGNAPVFTIQCNTNRACESVLENVRLTCNASTSAGILIRAYNGVPAGSAAWDFSVFRNVMITGGAVGIDVQTRMIYCTFDRVYCNSQESFGLRVSSGSGAVQINTNTFTSCYFANSKGFGVKFDCPGNNWNNNFIACCIENNSLGDMEITAQLVNVIGCYFEASADLNAPALIINGHANITGCNFVGYKYLFDLIGKNIYHVTGCVDYNTETKIVRFGPSTGGKIVFEANQFSKDVDTYNIATASVLDKLDYNFNVSAGTSLDCSTPYVICNAANITELANAKQNQIIFVLFNNQCEISSNVMRSGIATTFVASTFAPFIIDSGKLSTFKAQ